MLYTNDFVPLTNADKVALSNRLGLHPTLTPETIYGLSATLKIKLLGKNKPSTMVLTLGAKIQVHWRFKRDTKQAFTWQGVVAHLSLTQAVVDYLRNSMVYRYWGGFSEAQQAELTKKVMADAT